MISSFGKIVASFVVPHVYILGVIWFCHFVLFYTSVCENMFYWVCFASGGSYDFNIGSLHIVQVFLWGKTFSCVEEVELSTSVLWERISGRKFFVVLYASIVGI